MSDEGPGMSDLDQALADSVAAGRAVIARCTVCEHSFWHPRNHCPRCGARDVELVTPSGPARVYTATVNRRPSGGDRDAEPVQVGYVEFPEGVRMLVTLGFPDGQPTIGTEVAPERDGDGASSRLVYRPISRV